jgi:hypothetical protein
MRWGRYGVLLCLTFGVGALVGCGGTSESPPGPSTTSDPQTLDEFAQRFASSYCQSIAACCSNQGLATTDCESTLQAQVRAGFQEPGSSLDTHLRPEAAKRCIDAYTAALSACMDRALLQKTEVACDGLYEGTVPIGGQCQHSAECAERDHVACSGGVCTTFRRPIDYGGQAHRKLGETCAVTCQGTADSFSCGVPTIDADPSACWAEDGLYCDNGICATAPKTGEACASSSCDGTSHCVNGVCVADTSDGPCALDSDCLGTTMCDFGRRTCVPLRADGEPCEAYDQCLGGQCEEGHCGTWTAARANRCLGNLDD